MWHRTYKSHQNATYIGSDLKTPEPKSLLGCLRTGQGWEHAREVMHEVAGGDAGTGAG